MRRDFIFFHGFPQIGKNLVRTGYGLLINPRFEFITKRRDQSLSGCLDNGTSPTCRRWPSRLKNDKTFVGLHFFADSRPNQFRISWHRRPGHRYVQGLSSTWTLHLYYFRPNCEQIMLVSTAPAQTPYAPIKWQRCIVHMSTLKFSASQLTGPRRPHVCETFTGSRLKRF